MWIVRTEFLVLGLVGFSIMAEDPLVARESPAAGAVSSDEAWDSVRILRNRFLKERVDGEEAAVAGSYKTAVRRYKSMKDLLQTQRLILEKLIAGASGSDEIIRVRSELDRNSARLAEVKEVLKILDLALGDEY